MDDKYNKYSETYRLLLAKEEKKDFTIGIWKLVVTIGLLGALIAGFRQGFPLVWLAIDGMLLIFNGIIWVRHYRIRKKMDYFKGMLAVVQRYINRKKGVWTSFPDDGSEYINRDHAYTYDLDIFGPKSLFQYINETNTIYGRLQLKKDLENPVYNQDQISRRQEAVAELARSGLFALELAYYGGKITERKNMTTLMAILKEKEVYVENHILKFILRYSSIIVAPLAIGIFLFHFLPVQAAYLLLLCHVVIWGVFLLPTNRYIGKMTGVKYGLSKYQKLYAYIEKQNFESPLLQEIKNSLAASQMSASNGIKELDAIMTKVEMRSNVILYFILNIFLLWDMDCAIALEQWRFKYGERCESWFENMGCLESLLSFSVLKNVDEDMCFPSFAREKLLRVEGMGHPLIQKEHRVCNDYQMLRSINMLSGSNMSGKTTFLRTIAVNLVLAKNGSYVCARSMCFSDVQVITSMRIADDLNEGISTFYQELKKIKAILDLCSKDENTIFFIDEIFRGTNSIDRMEGAKAVIQKLDEYNVCGFLTTHDLELCTQEGIGLDNWHFSERFQEEELYFDYRIKPGIATSTNGQYLMKMLGIL